MTEQCAHEEEMVVSHGLEDAGHNDEHSDEHSEAAHQSVAQDNVKAWVQAHFAPDGHALPFHNTQKKSVAVSREDGDKTHASCASAFMIALTGFKSRGKRKQEALSSASESHGFLSGATTSCGSL